MNIVEETSKYNMSDFYKILYYLPKSRVDRQHPVNLKSKSVVRNKSYLVLPTIHQDFNGTDSVELYINCHGEELDASKLSLNFSPLLNGNTPVLSLKPKEETIDKDKETIVSFEIDSNNTMSDPSKKLTGIQSIKIDFEDTVNEIDILDMIIRSFDYTYTLTDIHTSCIKGKDYVLRRLNDARDKNGKVTIPDHLYSYVYMAGAAYAWLTRWEYESKPMKEQKSESVNYADRLFGQVDTALEDYLSNIENNRNEEYLDLSQVAYAGITWGIR